MFFSVHKSKWVEFAQLGYSQPLSMRRLDYLVDSVRRSFGDATNQLIDYLGARRRVLCLAARALFMTAGDVALCRLQGCLRGSARSDAVRPNGPALACSSGISRSGVAGTGSISRVCQIAE